MLTVKRAVIYTRAGAAPKTTTEYQLLQLRQYAERMGFEIRAEIFDLGTKGGKGRSAGYKRLCTMIARQQADIVLAHSVEVLSRSLNDLVGFLLKLQAKEVELFLHEQQELDTSSPSARALLAVLAELERSLVRDRIRLGLDRAKKNGTTLGRPSRANTPEVIAEVRGLREQGMPVHKIARKLKIGVETTSKILVA